MGSDIQDNSLRPDIRPIPVKARAPLGVAEIFLDEGISVKAVGIVYGMEHSITGEGFSAELFLDHYNQRIKIRSYEGPNIEGLIMKIRSIATANNFDKIFAMAPRQDWEKFLAHGYVLEAVLKYYLRGEDAFIVSKFRSQERLTSGNLMEEILLIEQIMGQPVRSRTPPLDATLTVRLARKEDIPQLVQLYQVIFDTYPSPLMYVEYLERIFQTESLFAVALDGDRVISAASAELAPVHRAAELTDCATLPDYRGRNLMSHLLLLLEKELIRTGYTCGYTMARARSFGMNNVFYQLGYEFQGRMVNNCDIYGAYEDMNIWVKSLAPEGATGQ